MADEPDRPDHVLRRRGDALAYVCAHFAELHDDLGGDLDRDGSLMDLLRDAVRGGGDVDGSLAALHDALQASGDALGVYGATRGPRPVGLDPHPAESVYLCPAGRCSRYWWPQGATAVPRCEMSGEPLRRDRL